MSESDRNKYPDEKAVAQAVRGLPGVEAEPRFRAELREAFVSGRIADGAADGDDLVVSLPAPRRFPIALRVAASIAVLIFALSALFYLNRGPRTTVYASAGEGELLVGTSSLSLSDHAGIEEALRPGVELEVPAEGLLDLEMPGIAVYEVAGGTRMTMPDAPGRWFARSAACSVLVGELRFKSRAGFAGAELVFHTPDGMVVATGTLLSVQCDETGTCVCVMEGVVHVGVDEADLELVEPGDRKVMPREGETFIVPVKPMHRDGVLDFDHRLENSDSP